LAGALRATGATPVIMPMIELAPIDSGPGASEIERAIASVESYSSLVFTSSNAVRFFVRALEAGRGSVASEGPTGRSLAAGVRVFCVGDATARYALEAGLPVHLVASGRSDAEALLAQLLPALSDGRGAERVLIPRSQIGRTVIADGLRAAGAEVDSVAFYENRRPEIDETGLRAQLVAGELDALTFTSPSTVDHFLASLDEESRVAAGHCMIAAIGRTTARRLDAVGLPAAIVPDRPEVPAMIEGLVSLDWPRRVFDPESSRDPESGRTGEGE
jgi:uroporphyrinogen-III synthase